MDSDDPTPNLETGANMDSGPSLHDDLGDNSETGPALHDDSRLPLDSENSSEPSTSTRLLGRLGTSRTAFCINCRVNIRRLRSHSLEIVEVRSVVQQWLLPQRVVVSSTDYVCHSCWNAAWNEIRHPATPATSPRTACLICIGCGLSLRRQRYHVLSRDSEREGMIMNIIAEQIAPRVLQTSSDRICHPCWQRSDRAAAHSETRVSPSIDDSHHEDESEADLENINNDAASPEVRQQEVPTILLPSYSRAADTQRRCFVPGCTESVRLLVPASLRVILFCEHKYYVPAQCRICHLHLRSNSWDYLDELIDNPIQMFSAAHIEEFALLLQQNMQFHLDFNNIESIPEHILHFYLGLTKAQFNELLNEVPRLSSRHRGMFALAAYLMKLRTGDSDERIASLLQVPRSTLERLMKIARELLNEDFVPQNLGINHISRAVIAQRNLLIPNGLFGGEESKPIIIADGTYIYIEKSSNYLYQKKTYSLHKYTNLVKPFLFVCSDGYIIDVLGPYPATTSDADIIRNEFSDNNSPYRQFFQNGDVFVLDRGFRDSISLLESCNYDVHVPMSLQEGETQLSTLNANKSRTVTIVRWVVEAVNGIFKKSFKLFRQKYFNRASLHLMTDFSVAAALINRFHLRYRDRDDAAQLLQVIRENRYRNNDLADFVDERNLNRIRVSFTNINVLTDNIQEFPQLTESDLILFACGTYQLKQAKSYYGEHIRSNGCYRIEVSNDSRTSILEGSHFGNDCRLLRAKIQSRHITRKTYFVYILIRLNETGRAALQQYCCNCIIGRRTVGCCAHVMSVIWYLGWARHQTAIAPPAGFLDTVLLVYDDE